MKRRHLGLVHAGEELTGKGPSDFERLARSCHIHSQDHLGVLAIALALAERTVVACVAPSVKSELLSGLYVLREHLRMSNPREHSLMQIEQARARCFQAAPVIERTTVEAVRAARAPLESSRPELANRSALDAHADHIVERYVRLAAHFACAATCHALDTVQTPSIALEVLEDTRGARAYQLTGLGAARQPALRAAAIDQAGWEHARLSHDQSEASLTVQVFHEYLGGRYRNYADAEAIQQEQFIRWAISGRSILRP